jgi:hypothetical protein
MHLLKQQVNRPGIQQFGRGDLVNHLEAVLNFKKMQLHTKATKANTKEYQKYIFCVLGIGIFFVLFCFIPPLCGSVKLPFSIVS